MKNILILFIIFVILSLTVLLFLFFYSNENNNGSDNVAMINQVPHRESEENIISQDKKDYILMDNEIILMETTLQRPPKDRDQYGRIFKAYFMVDDDTNRKVSGIKCDFLEKPIKSNPLLQIINGDTIDFSSDNPGRYIINCKHLASGSERDFVHGVDHVLPDFDKSKVSVHGTIENQVWVSSFSLDVSGIKTVLGEFPLLKIIHTEEGGNFSDSSRVLIEFDDKDVYAKEQVEALKLRINIDYVHNRLDQEKLGDSAVNFGM